MRVGDQRHEVTGEGAAALGAHGVALVGHGGGADLILLKGFFHFLEVGQQAPVGGDFMGAGGHRTEGREDIAVDLARIGLAGDGVALGKAKGVRHQLVELFHLVVVAVEEGQKAGLGAGGALHPAEAQVGALALQVAQIHDQVLDPQAGALADGGQLRRLEVGKAEGWLVFPVFGKAGHAVDDAGEFGQEDVQAVAEHQQFAIIGDVARGCTEVNDRRGFGGGGGKGVDVGHDVVAAFALFLGGAGVVDVGEVGFHRRQLLIADCQAQAIAQPAPIPTTVYARCGISGYRRNSRTFPWRHNG